MSAVTTEAKEVSEKRSNAIADEEMSELANTIGNKCDSMIFSGKLRDMVRMISNFGKEGLYKPTKKCPKAEIPVINVLHTKYPNIRVTNLHDEDQSEAFSCYLGVMTQCLSSAMKTVSPG